MLRRSGAMLLLQTPPEKLEDYRTCLNDVAAIPELERIQSSQLWELNPGVYVSVFRVVVVESCEERAVHEKIVKLIFAHLGVRDPVIQIVRGNIVNLRSLEGVSHSMSSNPKGVLL
mmetsp:Transcript_24379/g.60805  ORF Transcript_24379/g.60805 Transcript_24379/m.60805 type:complete len:116 (-) Transcript_24379:760-1107(-)